MEWNDSWDAFKSDIHEPKWEIIKEKIGEDYYPQCEKTIFRFMECNIYNLKVVILGQEPYNDNATGRAFEVKNITNWLDTTKHRSIQNIFKAIDLNESHSNNKINIKLLRNKYKNSDKLITVEKWFDKIEQEGVLFLNTSLTVEKGIKKSHLKYWETYVSELLRFLNDKNHFIVWVACGKIAEKMLVNYMGFSNVIVSPHPMLNKFVDENPFSKIKNVDWSIMK